jgi:hypothetical protein
MNYCSINSAAVLAASILYALCNRVRVCFASIRAYRNADVRILCYTVGYCDTADAMRHRFPSIALALR